MVVGTPPPPSWITLPPFLGATSQKLRARVRGSSRNAYVLPGASRKQSPPVSGSGSGIPSTLSQQLPRETIPKCASWDGELLETADSGTPSFAISASCIRPQGAVASSRACTTLATCIVLNTSVIGSTPSHLPGR